ncbi:DUF2867 domain-containing protein [Amycolatopsis sp. H20-H5]|uniref:DUF2867 domain-containing protein n=1 Tax=Amycolatopsis sp. H20-H5 TaxID=3046309 RepID=UPI002DBF9A1B|nr:DUF2867 domain-containing protein [Amycolatopsis sp. H20-H5]MEC3981648.1 DUF2867 domain-containing protein [Amycolatopsis sp. H20-H5]
MGATGYLGSQLIPCLIAAGHDVHALVRDPRAGRFPATVTVHAGDATKARDVRAALSGVDVAYFLVHSLDRADFAAVDRLAATVLAEEATREGVAQLVYVGGTRPASPGHTPLSPHLASRAEVGDILTGGPVPALVLQASMIIGNGSTSFDLLRTTTRRAPLLPQPRWMSRRSRPVAVADVLHYLRVAAELPSPVNGAFDVSGPETLSYLSLVQRCARVLGLPARLPIPAPLWSHRIAALVAGLTTPIPAAVAAPLFESLDHDMLPSDADVTERLPPPPGGTTTVDNAIRAAADRPGATPASGEPFVDEHVLPSAATADELWRTITGLGGADGWHTLPLVWSVRGAVDHLIGGVGLYRGRGPELAGGDVVDFWTVRERDDTARRLVLRADMKMPGQTLLEMSVTQDERGVSYHQKITFTPDGIAGKLYWQLQKPLHDLVFTTMARNIARS